MGPGAAKAVRQLLFGPLTSRSRVHPNIGNLSPAIAAGHQNRGCCGAETPGRPPSSVRGVGCPGAFCSSAERTIPRPQRESEGRPGPVLGAMKRPQHVARTPSSPQRGAARASSSHSGRLAAAAAHCDTWRRSNIALPACERSAHSSCRSAMRSVAASVLAACLAAFCGWGPQLASAWSLPLSECRQPGEQAAAVAQRDSAPVAILPGERPPPSALSRPNDALPACSCFARLTWSRWTSGL